MYDPEPHRALRTAINSDFRAGQVVSRWADVTREIVVDEIESYAPGEVVNFVEAIARRIPVRLIATMLGLDDSGSDDYVRWTAAVINSLQPGVIGEWGPVVEMFDFFEAELESRKVTPRDDILTSFAQAAATGKIADEQALMLAWEVMAAGIDTTVYLLGSGLQALLERPEQRELLFSTPDLIPKATAEMLRWSTPLRYHARRAEEDTQIRGVDIAKGEWVMANFLMANRDPEIFADPFSFDITRKSRPGYEYLSFGYGQHSCLGAGVAKLEARIVLEELLARCPDMALAGSPVYRPDTLVNGIAQLPVVLRPA